MIVQLRDSHVATGSGERSQVKLIFLGLRRFPSRGQDHDVLKRRGRRLCIDGCSLRWLAMKGVVLLRGCPHCVDRPGQFLLSRMLISNSDIDGRRLFYRRIDQDSLVVYCKFSSESLSLALAFQTKMLDGDVLYFLHPMTRWCVLICLNSPITFRKCFLDQINVRQDPRIFKQWPEVGLADGLTTIWF